MAAETRTRNNYLDWLRWMAILFVFIYHSTRFYNVEDWQVKNDIWYPAVERWNNFATSWMMPLIFIISGASLFYAVGKGNFLKFLKDKVLRLLVPLLVADLTHISIQAYLGQVFHGEFSGSFFQFLPHYYTNISYGFFEGMHLWYLLLLFIFSLLLYPLIRWLRGGGVKVLAALSAALEKPGILYSVVLPVPIFYLVLDSEGILMREQGGYPYIGYLWYLLLGFFLISTPQLQEKVRRLRWISLAAGLALIAGFIVIYSQLPNQDELSTGLIISGLMRIFGGWMVVLAILGLGIQHLTKRTPFLEYANEAVLPFYILHQTVLITVGYFVLQCGGLPEVIEWAVIVVVSFAVILGLYEFLVRRWNVMRVLFGMKPLPRKNAN